MNKQGRNHAVALAFADNLRGRRRHVGYSQDVLAKYSGLHRTEISLIERGLREPRVQTIVKLATALDISAGDLLDGIDWQLPGEGDGAILVSGKVG